MSSTTTGVIAVGNAIFNVTFAIEHAHSYSTHIDVHVSGISQM